jgi:ABC-2 type transport system permease protein
MRTIIFIIIKEFNQLKRDPRLRATIIIAPILQLLLMGYAATTDVNNISLAICDQDKSVTSREFIRSFVSSGYFTVEYNINDYNQLDHLIDKGSAQVALIIPPSRLSSEAESSRISPQSIAMSEFGIIPN